MDFWKKEGYFGIFYKARLFAVRERPRCSSRTTALPFATGSAALREQQIKTTSRNRETDVRNWKIGCLISCFEQSWYRQYLYHRLHVNLYAVSAINRKSIIVLRRIGGHWQVKTETPYYCQSLCLFLKHFTRIGCPAVLVVDNALIMSQKTRTTQGQPRLSLSTNWHTMCYAVQGQPDNLFGNTCFIWIPYHINSHLLGVFSFHFFCWTRIAINYPKIVVHR